MSLNSGKTDAELRLLYLSPASRHALAGMRALAVLKGKPGFRLVSEAARQGGLPANALAKVFQRLAQVGLLVSQRGPGGGYALSRDAGSIRLSEIVEAVQDIIPGGRHCLLGNRRCNEGALCLIHQVVIKADRAVIEGLGVLTLRDLIKSGGWT